VILTQPQFDRLGVRPEAINSYFDEKLDQLEQEIRDLAAGADRNDPTVKQLETAKNNMKAKLDALLKKQAKEDTDEVKCWHCNSRGVDTKTNGVWIHAECE
jgi:hypothetical protein